MDVPAGVTQEEGNTGFSIHLLRLNIYIYIIYGVYLRCEPTKTPYRVLVLAPQDL